MTATVGHNSSGSHALLRNYCRRLVSLENDKDEINDEIKEIKARAKSEGFDPGLIGKTVRLMKMDEAKRKKAVDQLSLFDTYLSAVGVLGVLDEAADPPEDETAEESGERRGRAGQPPDEKIMAMTDGSAEVHIAAWHRGNKARITEGLA